MSEEYCRTRACALLDQVGINEPPIDVEKVAESLGLVVERVRRGSGFSGRLSRERMIVEVEQTTHLHRQRFTIAHEIGHYVLNHNPVFGVFDDWSTTDPNNVNERQANLFASELLMPEALVQAHWTKLKNNRAMASLFLVSEQAMFYRLEGLGLLGLDPRL